MEPKINSDKIFQDLIDYEIIKSIIDYLLIRKNNFNYNKNIYNIQLYFDNINEIFNYILVSKKWYQYISLTISNNIINNNSFEYWFKIKYNYINPLLKKNKQNIENLEYDYIYLNNKCQSINQEYSIIKINQSIINKYFKKKLYLNEITFEGFKKIQEQLENNQLQYERIVVKYECIDENYGIETEDIYNIIRYLSHIKDEEKISKIFKVLEFNCDAMNILYMGFDDVEDLENSKLFFNNLGIFSYYCERDENDDPLIILKFLKSKNINFNASTDNGDEKHIVLEAFFDPEISGKQVESIEIVNEGDEYGFVVPIELIKINQFEKLHSIKIPIHFHQLLSNLASKYKYDSYSLINSCNNNLGEYTYHNLESDINDMVNSLVTSKSLRNLSISSICDSRCFEENINDFLLEDYPENQYDFNIRSQEKIKIINEIKQIISNSFKPLFSELNKSIEFIQLDCHSTLNTNTFSNLLNNKTIKYLELKDSDFIYYKFKELNIGEKDLLYGKDLPNGEDLLYGKNFLYGKNLLYEKEIISINQYLIENILTSPLTSIRHYFIQIDDKDQLKSIFNLLKNNIFKLQLYSIKLNSCYNFTDNILEEINDLTNYISSKQQSNKVININLKEINFPDNKSREKIKNNNPYFILN